MNRLPSELIISIFNLLSVNDISNLSKISIKFNDIYKLNKTYIYCKKLGVSDYVKWQRYNYKPRQLHFYNYVKSNEIENVKIIINNFRVQLHINLVNYCCNNNYIVMYLTLVKFFKPNGLITINKNKLVQQAFYSSMYLKDIFLILKNIEYFKYTDIKCLISSWFNRYNLNRCHDKIFLKDIINLIIDNNLYEYHLLYDCLSYKDLESSKLILEKLTLGNVKVLNSRYAKVLNYQYTVICSYKKTPLMLSIDNGSNFDSITKNLIKCTNVNLIDSCNCTALHYAYGRRPINNEIIQMLINYGINENIKDENNLKAIDYLR